METGMSELFLQEALDIVKAQASVRSMTEDEIVQMVRGLTKALGGLGACGAKDEEDPEGAPKDKGIRNSSVTCLECGKTFKLITKRHLASHGLTAVEYREKWGIKRKTALVCKTLQRIRRKKMKEMHLWEKRVKKVAETPTATPAPQKRGRRTKVVSS
jgi:predicted transcriptional regulator